MGIFKPNANKMLEKGDIEGLIKMLKGKSIDLRKDAVSNIRILALGGLGHRSVIIIRRNPAIQAMACWALVDTLREPIDAKETMMTIHVLMRLYDSGKLPSELMKPVEKLVKRYSDTENPYNLTVKEGGTKSTRKKTTSKKKSVK